MTTNHRINFRAIITAGRSANAGVFDGTGRPPLNCATILIEGSAVTAVGPASQVGIPEDCRVVDLQGKTVLPGLMDGYMHVTSMPGLMDTTKNLQAQLRASDILRECLQWGTTTDPPAGTFRRFPGETTITKQMLAQFKWHPDPANPVLPPDSSTVHESTRCMNPFVIRVADEYRLYYSGGDTDGHQRICMATAPVATPSQFTRRGVILGIGETGDFDARWCVLPCVHRFGDIWHMYYSGHEGTDLGLQSFPGIGLALSNDGLHFHKHSSKPVITGDQITEFPTNRGIAGGGSILEDHLPDGTIRYRMYYTLAVGTKSDDVSVDQEKHCAVCHSTDGIHWTDHRLILSPRPTVANEDIAVAAPFVWRDRELYRMLYCGIGTRWGFYSISEAVSEDGYRWHLGEGEQNLTLVPDPTSPWESEMVEYPGLIKEDDHLRLFYCGNGYGATGIGTAVTQVSR